MKRVLVHDYAGHPFQVQLSRELAGRGHEVLHAYAGGLQTPRGELVRRADDPPGFSVREVAMDAGYAGKKYAFARRRRMEIGYGREAARLVRAWRPDVVLSSNTPTEAQAPVLRATKEVGGRFVLWLQDFYSIAVDQLVRRRLPLAGAAIGAYYRHLDRLQFRQSDAIIAITEDFVPLLVDEFGVDRAKVTVVPNWAPLDALPVEPHDNPWSRSQGLDDKFVFLYTGTLGMKHNPQLLLALAEAFRGLAAVRVVVVSEGIGARWLAEEKAARGLSNLVLLPYQAFSDLSKVLGSGDVLVGVLEEDAGVFSVPSKVLTYLCAQRAILLAVPEVNLAARLVNRHQAGLTVPPSDQAAFLKAAQTLFENETLRVQKAHNCRSYAESAFKIPEIEVKFAKVLALESDLRTSSVISIPHP